jgi:hypothetical protein
MEALECMAKYPRLTAHMICESLGYFTPRAAGQAIAHYKAKKPYFCEWYTFMADRRVGNGDGSNFYNEEAVLETGHNVISQTFRLRHRHKGYMADINRAKELVRLCLEKDWEPTFASWF